MIKQFALDLANYIIDSDFEVTPESINKKKKDLSAKYNFPELPLNSLIIENLPKDLSLIVSKYLTIKNVRKRSGVNVIAVMTKPHRCPHGKCIYCPGGVEFNTPQAYVEGQPAVMRAQLNKYDPYLQTRNRLEQLEAIGHDVSKVELIVMGGTFNALDMDYQTNFIKSMYDALNDKISDSLEQAKELAQYNKHRPVGLTLETKPDWCKELQIESALNFGTTRFELGVQNLDDEAYKVTNRGHTLKDVEESTRLLKDSGFKVLYHLMPGLLGVDVDYDTKMFEQVYSDDRFKPDMAKIYPTLVIKGTALYYLWKREKYKAYTDQDFVDLLQNIYPNLPYWTRIMRVQREIPVQYIEAGPLKGNAREVVIDQFKKQNALIKEIRYRELGSRIPDGPYQIFVEKYSASKGIEYFISYETSDRQTLIGFIRLRLPYEPFIDVLKDSTALVRELHVYGNIVPVHKKGVAMGQHMGVGSMLLKKAEEVAKELGYNKLAVISGIGVREYYAKRGYFLDKYYMSKYL